MGKGHKVSVVMSVYNGARYLREAIDSILGQTFRDFEFIIINDGSTDVTRDIILSYDDPCIHLIENETNLGLPVSLNKGIRVARGEYIARQDADDVSLPERLERQVNTLDAHSSVGVVGCWWQRIDLDGRIFDVIKVPPEGEVLLQRMLNSGLNPSAHGSVMIRKEMINGVGAYDERFWFTQDFDLWLRMWPHCDFKLIPSFLYHLRELPAESRFKELCQREYYQWAIKQFKAGRRYEFEDVREYVRNTYPEAAIKDDKAMAKYWAGLGSTAMSNGLWREALFYYFKALRTGHPEVAGKAMARLLITSVRRIVPSTDLQS